MALTGAPRDGEQRTERVPEDVKSSRDGQPSTPGRRLDPILQDVLVDRLAAGLPENTITTQVPVGREGREELLRERNPTRPPTLRQVFDALPRGTLDEEEATDGVRVGQANRLRSGPDGSACHLPTARAGAGPSNGGPR